MTKTIISMEVDRRMRAHTDGKHRVYTYASIMGNFTLSH